MIGSGDFAKLLYWGCVVWPLISVIGIIACHQQQAKIRCHITVSFLLLILTIASFLVKDDFYLSIVWNHDDLTRFLRVMIALGSLIVTLSLYFWAPNQVYVQTSKNKSLINFSIFHLMIGIAILVVGINNFFIALTFLFLLIFLLMMACFFNGGSEITQVGWNYFRYILLFMIIALMGVFVLGLPVSQTHSLLHQFGSFMIAFGVILAIGIFPVFIPFLRLVTMLPSILGGIILFLVPLSFLTLFLRLYQIADYQNPQLFLLTFVCITLLVLLLKEKDDPFLLITPLLVTLTLLAGIFADHIEGIYNVCLMVTMLVIFAPIGYIINKTSYANIFRQWFLWSISAFPPFGIFLACSSLISYLIIVLPWFGWGLLGLFSIRGYLFFQSTKFPLFSKQMLTREGCYLTFIMIISTLLIPFLATHWIYPIAKQFVQN